MDKCMNLLGKQEAKYYEESSEFICNFIFIDDWVRAARQSGNSGSNQEGLVCLDMIMTGLYP